MEGSSLGKESELLPSLEPSSEVSSSEPAKEFGNWSVDSSLIPDSAQSQYLNDCSFSVMDSLGKEISFHGDYIQRGKGEWDGTIQMKKGDSLLECETPLTGTLTLSIKKRLVSYGGEDHDYTGVPVFSVSSDQSSWTETEGRKSEGGESVVYVYDLASSYFRFSASSSNAIYLISMSFVA